MREKRLYSEVDGTSFEGFSEEFVRIRSWFVLSEFEFADDFSTLFSESLEDF